MRTKKFKTIISILLSMVLIVSTLAATPADKAQATYMPIKTYEGLKLDMTGFLPNYLSNVPVSTVLSNIKDKDGNPVVASGSAVAYKFSYEGNYHVIKSDDATIDFSREYRNYLSNNMYNYSSSMEIICGKLDQLNLSNVRYLIDKIEFASPIESISYKDANGKDLKAFTQINYSLLGGNGGYIDQINIFTTFDPEEVKTKDKVTYSIKSLFKDNGVTVKSIKGNFIYEDMIPGGSQDYTEALFGNGETCEVGSSLEDLPKWTLGFTKENQEYLCSFRMIVITDSPQIDTPIQIAQVDIDGNYLECWSEGSEITDLDDDVIEKKKVSYSLDSTKEKGKYIFKPVVGYNRIDRDVDVAAWANETIQKTVVGEYTNIADAESKEDITQKLFVEDGYVIDDDTDFTVFYKGGDILIISVDIFILESTEDPLYFGIYQIYKDNTYNNPYNTFTINRGMDSYYDDGYRGILINRSLYDDNTIDMFQAPIASGSAISLRPSYSVQYGVELYIVNDNGEKEILDSGVSLIDYNPDTTLHYIVTRGDKQQDYYYNIVGQKSGSELFTIAEEDAQGNKSRNIVFLGSNYHDVFFANVGDTDIEGLTVELKDAKNVKLDEYWTIGETGKLAKFVEIPAYDDQYDYYVGNSIGKIRLLSDENSEGEISGTLVIGYNGSNGEKKEIKIALKGYVATPRITTTQLPKAKVGVPYSATIENNMPELKGASVSYELSGGDYPRSFEMTPDGKLSGTPDASDYEYYSRNGSYSINVLMKYVLTRPSGTTSTFYTSKTLTLDLEKEQETTNTDPEPSQNDSTYTEPSNDDNTSSGYSDNTST
ncbi:MAG: hypothetical protein K6E95_07845, partial [Lachnospiraceae bacterium]|nr:hypothetical protein [Lachnospiraceae bacterium]